MFNSNITLDPQTKFLKKKNDVKTVVDLKVAEPTVGSSYLFFCLLSFLLCFETFCLHLYFNISSQLFGKNINFNLQLFN